MSGSLDSKVKRRKKVVRDRKFVARRRNMPGSLNRKVTREKRCKRYENHRNRSNTSGSLNSKVQERKWSFEIGKLS